MPAPPRTHCTTLPSLAAPCTPPSLLQKHQSKLKKLSPGHRDVIKLAAEQEEVRVGRLVQWGLHTVHLWACACACARVLPGARAAAAGAGCDDGGVAVVVVCTGSGRGWPLSQEEAETHTERAARIAREAAALQEAAAAAAQRQQVWRAC